jgi:hypothetical protein
MSKEFLLDWLHRKDLSQTVKLMVVLSTFESPAPLKEVLDRAESAGVKRRFWSNPSASLARTSGLAVHTDGGWELTKAGREKLANQGIVSGSSGAINVATDLRSYLQTVTDPETADFVGETIRCYEMQLYRSATVMSWLAAVYVLQREVVTNHLSAFNKEARRIDSRWKSAKTTDDIGRMKESDFLDRLASLGIIGKNVKGSLKECLDRRNACGHPNSYKLGQNTVAAHIELLLLNVFKPIA